MIDTELETLIAYLYNNSQDKGEEYRLVLESLCGYTLRMAVANRVFISELLRRMEHGEAPPMMGIIYH